MITIKKRLSYLGERSIEGGVNTAIDELQAAINKIGVIRYTQSVADSDYFMFDNDNSKLYLHTIEGATFEITLTEV